MKLRGGHGTLHLIKFYKIGNTWQGKNKIERKKNEGLRNVRIVKLES